MGNPRKATWGRNNPKHHLITWPGSRVTHALSTREYNEGMTRAKTLCGLATFEFHYYNCRECRATGMIPLARVGITINVDGRKPRCRRCSKILGYL